MATKQGTTRAKRAKKAPVEAGGVVPVPVEEEGKRAEPHTEAIIPEVVDVKKEEQERTRIKKELFLETLRKTLGNIKEACYLSDVGRRTFYEWREDDHDFRLALQKVEAEMLEDVEGVVFTQVRKGDGNLAMKVLQARDPRYKRNVKVDIVTGNRTLEDIIYEMAEKRRAIAEGRDPNTVKTEAKELGEGQTDTPPATP